MSKVRIYGDTSGYVDIAVPAVAGTTTLNLDKIPQADITTGNIAMDTDTLFIDAQNNRVGIGTNSPAIKLHINQPGNTQQVRIQGSNTYDFYSYNDNNFYINNPNGTILGLLANKDAYFSKNLSLGDSVLSTYHTSYPALELGSSASVQGYTGNNGIWLQSNLFMNTNGQWTSKSDDFSAMLELYDGNFNFYNTASGTGTRPLLTPMTIRQNGNVGIGTNNPGSIFHINMGTDKNIQFSGSIGEIGSVPGFQATNDASSALSSLGMRGSTLRFATGDDERMRIEDNAVGIGTESPSTTDSGYNKGALHVHNASGSGAQVRWTNSTTGTGTSDGFMISKWSDKNTYMTNFDNGANTVFTQSNSSGTLVTTMTLDGDGDIGIGTTPYANARLTIGGTEGGGYPAVLQFDNNNTSGAEFFMLATDTNWSAGSNKFIMGHGAPASSNADVTIDGSGNVGIGTTSPNAPLNIVHANLSGEPYCGLRINNTSGSGSYYTGVEVNAVGQSHYRYSLAGSLKWQTRVGYGNGTDKFSIYSWTHSDDMFVIDNSGRMHAKSLSISSNPNSPVTGNLYSSGDGIIISAGQQTGFSGGAGQGTHLEMGTNSDSGWASQYVQRYNYGGGGSNDDRMFQFTVNQSAVGHIRSTTSGTSYQSSSDYRVKKNIVNLTSTDSIIKQLRPIEFESTSEEGTDFEGLKHVGFLAHEVQEAGVVDCVSGTKDQVDEDGEPVIQSMDYGKLTPYLVKSLQDALTKIDALETRIKTLES